MCLTRGGQLHRFQKKVELHTLFEHESLPHAQLGEDADAFLTAECEPGPVPGAAGGGAGGGQGAVGGVRREK